MRIDYIPSKNKFKKFNVLPEINPVEENLNNISKIIYASCGSAIVSGGDLQSSNFVKGKKGWKLDSDGTAHFIGLETEWINVGNTDGKKPADNADITADNAQAYAWITGSKPPVGADVTQDELNLGAAIDHAKANGITLIDGGYINTGIITCDNITAGTLTGRTVQTHSNATTGSKLVAGAGLKIYGDYATFYSSSTAVGHIHASSTSNLQIAAYNGKTLELLGANGAYMNAGGNNCELRQGNTAYIRITAANYSGFVGSSSKYFGGIYTQSVYFRQSSSSQKYITINASSGLETNTDFYVGGALSKASGSFKIDHPLKPKTHWLEHSFVESPNMLNLYTGNAIIKKGICKIKMPKWFIALNGKNQDEFTYQLTSIGQPNNLWVKQEMNNKGEVIFTGEKDGKFSYIITAIRHDKWAEKHRVKVESKKLIK